MTRAEFELLTNGTDVDADYVDTWHNNLCMFPVALVSEAMRAMNLRADDNLWRIYSHCKIVTVTLLGRETFDRWCRNNSPAAPPASPLKEAKK